MSFRKILAFFRKHLLDKLSYKLEFFVDFVGILSNSVIFFYIAKLTAPGVNPLLKPYTGDYFPFVLIGLAFSGYQAAAVNSAAHAIATEQSTGTLEAIAMTSTSLWTVMFAGFLWDFFLTTLHVAGYLALGSLVFHVDLSRINLCSLGLALLMMTLSLAGLGLFSAGFTLAFKRGNPINLMIQALSKVLSGVYFPIAIFPAWIQGFSFLLPLTHSLEAVRKSILQGADVQELQPQYLALLLFSAFFLPLGILFFRWAEHRAKKDGSLAFF